MNQNTINHRCDPLGAGRFMGEPMPIRASAHPRRSRRGLKRVVRMLGILALLFGAWRLSAEEALLAIQAEGEEAGKTLLHHAAVDVDIGGLRRAPELRVARGKTFNTGGFAPDATTLEEAVAMDQYIELPFSVAAGTVLELRALDLSYDISETGPRAIEVCVSLDGFETRHSLYADESVDPKGEKWMDESLETPLRLEGSECALRIYAWGAASPRGTLDFEDMGANVCLALRGIVVSSGID